jgi:hypothetical protein
MIQKLGRNKVGQSWLLGAVALGTVACGGGGGGGGDNLNGHYYVCRGTYTKTELATGMIIDQNKPLFVDNYCGDNMATGANNAVNAACTCANDGNDGAAASKCKEELDAKDGIGPDGKYSYSYTVVTATKAVNRLNDKCDPDAEEIAFARQSLIGGTAEQTGPLVGNFKLQVSVEVVIGIPPLAYTETRTYSDNSALSGRVDYTVNGDLGSCGAGGCPFEISRFVGSAGDIDIEGHVGTNITFINAGPLRGIVKDDGSVIFPPGAMPLTVNFDQDGSHNSSTVANADPITGRVLDDGATLELDTINVSQGSAEMTLSGMRVSANLKRPEAQIVPASGDFECESGTGTAVTFDGRSSTSALPLYRWRADGGAVQTTDGLFSPSLGLGEHTVVLDVENALGGVDSASATIRVLDRTAPTFGPLSATIVPVCDVLNEGVQLTAPQAFDGCTGVANVVGRVIATNGVTLSNPIQLNAGSGALDAGTHQVVWSATDNAGNVGEISQVISVVPAFYALKGAVVADGAKLKTAFGAPAGWASGAGGEVELGVEAQTGTIRSFSPVRLRDRARVFGKVFSSGSIQLSNGALTDGIFPFSNVLLPAPATVDAAMPTGGPSVMLEPDRTRALAPGSYGQVGIKSRSKLQLSDGIYSLTSLMVEPDAVIELRGNVQLVIGADFTFRGRVTYIAGATLSVVYLGTATSFIERQFGSVRLYAPFAKVVLGAANIESFVGAITAKQFEVAPRATLTCDL